MPYVRFLEIIYGRTAQNLFGSHAYILYGYDIISRELILAYGTGYIHASGGSEKKRVVVNSKVCEFKHTLVVGYGGLRSVVKTYVDPFIPASPFFPSRHFPVILAQDISMVTSTVALSSLKDASLMEDEAVA